LGQNTKIAGAIKYFRERVRLESTEIKYPSWMKTALYFILSLILFGAALPTIAGPTPLNGLPLILGLLGLSVLYEYIKIYEANYIRRKTNGKD
jgi:hypothetical protein